jgi:hypothetical protein
MLYNNESKNVTSVERSGNFRTFKMSKLTSKKKNKTLKLNKLLI